MINNISFINEYFLSGNHIYLFKGRCDNCSGKSAILDTMQLDVGNMSSICVQFWYYLYGSTIDTLRLNVVNDNGTTEIWSISGDQGEQWYMTQTEIQTSDSTILLQVEGVYGSGQDSDISLDDISIYEGPCVPSMLLK